MEKFSHIKYEPIRDAIGINHSECTVLFLVDNQWYAAEYLDTLLLSDSPSGIFLVDISPEFEVSILITPHFFETYQLNPSEIKEFKKIKFNFLS